MKYRNIPTQILLGILITFGAATQANAAHGDPWYTEPLVYEFRPKTDRDIEFGPIGVTGIEATIKKGVVVTIQSIAAGSPADGLCKPGDVILGVNGERLEGRNPFVVLGKALTEAESKDGVLLFELKNRGGVSHKVKVQIPVLGAYSETYPHNCPKTDHIVNEAAAFYAAQIHGTAKKPQKIGHLEASLVGLFLLSTGDDSYLPTVRKIFEAELKDPALPADGSSTWYLGYRGLLLGEYYLRTGDRSVLPRLEGICTAAKLGQRYDVGWAHGIYTTPTVYWLMNAAGAQIVTTQLFGKMCGVEVDDDTLCKSLRFYYRFVGHSCVPYGDHRPGGYLGSNGKDGMAGAAMGLAARGKGDVKRFELAHQRNTLGMANQYPGMIRGHGDHGRGDAKWRGISLAGLQDLDPARFREEMDRYTWWIDLARKHDGGFYIPALHKFDDIGSGVVIGLMYTASRKTLQLTGAPRSPYAVDFTVPDIEWGTEADLAFLSTEHCPGYEDYPHEEPLHVTFQRLVLASEGGRGRKPFANEVLPLEYILKYVRHQETEIRTGAAKALRHFGHFDELEKLLRNPDPRLRRAALDGIIDNVGHFLYGKHRLPTDQYTPGINNALTEILNNPNEAWWVIDGAMLAMNQAPLETVRKNLARMGPWTRSDESFLRMSAFYGMLGARSDKVMFRDKILPILLAMLQDTNRTNHESMIKQMSLILEEEKGQDNEMVETILAGFSEAVKETKFQKDEGLSRRRAESLHMLEMTVNTAMKSSPESALSISRLLADRLHEIDNPKNLVSMVAAPSTKMGPKSRIGFYSMLGKIKSEADRRALIELLDTKYRPRMVELLNGPPIKEARVHSNLILSIADIAKLADRDRGWQALGTPVRDGDLWRYHTFNTTSKMTTERGRFFITSDFMNAKLPAGMEGWSQPGFDVSMWQRGKPPFGKGKYQGHYRVDGRDIALGFSFPTHTVWPEDDEFILMQKEIMLDRDEFESYGLYKLGVLSAGCYKVLVNGKQVYFRHIQEEFPRYDGKLVKTLEELNFKPGKNTIAVMANHYWHWRHGDPRGQADVRLEGLDASELQPSKQDE